MSYGKRMLFDAIRSLASGSVAAGYTAVGTAIAFPARILIIQNYTDALLTFSFNGLTDHFVLAANTQMIIDVTSNAAAEDAFFFGEGDILYVKQNAVPTTGTVYFSMCYGKGD